MSLPVASRQFLKSRPAFLQRRHEILPDPLDGFTANARIVRFFFVGSAHAGRKVRREVIQNPRVLPVCKEFGGHFMPHFRARRVCPPVAHPCHQRRQFFGAFLCHRASVSRIMDDTRRDLDLRVSSHEVSRESLTASVRANATFLMRWRFARFVYRYKARAPFPSSRYPAHASCATSSRSDSGT